MLRPSSSRWLAALTCSLVLAGAPAAASALESWECSAVRRHMLLLARPLLTAQGRVMYALDLDGAARLAMCARLTRAEYDCAHAARSYRAARACFRGEAPIELQLPPGVDAGVEVDVAPPPLPAPTALAGLTSARTFAIVVADTSDSATASAKGLTATVRALLGAAGLAPARRGKPADVTVELAVTGVAVALPYEDLGSGKTRDQYTATVLTGAVTLVFPDGTRVSRPFDLENVPTNQFPITTRHDRPRDAPWGRAFLDRGGPAHALLDLLLIGRGPAAHFHVLREARRYDGMLPFLVGFELERTSPTYLPAVRAALRDKRPAVRAAAAAVLGAIGEASDVAVLDGLARDRSAEVVDAAARASKRLTARPAPPAP